MDAVAHGGGFRRLPQTWRLGSRYAEFADLAKSGESWSPAEIQEYQLRQLRMVLHHAANFCPYYQRSFADAAFRPEHVRNWMISQNAHCSRNNS